MKATQRPTTQTRYAAQVKADRRAAALERRQDDYRTYEAFARMYAKN